MLQEYSDIEDRFYPITGTQIGVLLKKLDDYSRDIHRPIINKYPELANSDLIEISLGEIGAGPEGNTMYYDIPKYSDNSSKRIQERQNFIKQKIIESLSLNDVSLGSILISNPYAEDGKELARARLFRTQYGFGPLHKTERGNYQYMKYQPVNNTIGTPLSLYDDSKAIKAVKSATRFKGR